MIIDNKQKRLERIYKKYFESIYRFIYWRTGNKSDVEDIVADIFQKIIANIDKFNKQKGASLKSWIFAIARNTLIDYYRKNNKGSCRYLEENIEYEMDLDDNLDKKMLFEKALNLIKSFPPRQREIILLKYEAELKNKEIAKLFEIEEKTVASTLSRALKKISNKF